MQLPRWANERVVAPVMAQFRQGLTPSKIALSIVVGVTMGLCPVLNTTTMLCLVAAFLLRLNQPVVHVLNQAVAPLQFMLVIPFIRAGEFFFDAPALPLS